MTEKTVSLFRSRWLLTAGHVVASTYLGLDAMWFQTFGMTARPWLQRVLTPIRPIIARSRIGSP